nr:immunoglobulin heavy chain junction region [Mus musculus]
CARGRPDSSGDYW